MVFVVPYDSSDLAKSALVRATQYGDVFGESVVAITVIPDGNREYAREHDWMRSSEEYELSAIVATVHKQIAHLAPEADFKHIVVGRYAPSGTIASKIRKTAEDVGATVVFIGSENAGSLTSSVGSVGAAVAAGDEYDVHIVRHTDLSEITNITDAAPHSHEKSNFHLP